MSTPKFSIRLQISLSTLFLFLVLPAFILVVMYVYKTNSDIYKQHATELIARHGEQTSANLINLLDPIRDSLLVMNKQLADAPGLLHERKFQETLLLHLQNNPNLVSIFTASTDGTFRQVQRIKESMLVQGQTPPRGAKYNIWEVDRSRGQDPVSVFTFYKSATEPLTSFTVTNRYDPRERFFYKNLLKSLPATSEDFIFIEEPYVSASTSRPTFTLSSPVIVNGNFIGMVAESFEINTIAEFLKSIETSANSQTYIVDANGAIIVGTGPNNGLLVKGNTLVKQNLANLAGTPANFAFSKQADAGHKLFNFKYGPDGEEYFAQFTRFPNEFNKSWEVLNVVPLEDFFGNLYKINRQLIIYGGAMCFLLMFLCYLGSRAISRPIELLTSEIKDLISFNKNNAGERITSKIQEISILSEAIGKLKTTLNAFTSYVPRELVNDLVRTGVPLAPGGESRYLSIFFTDLKGFSTLAEVTPTRELLESVSAYLDMVTMAVKQEHGTIDKFIGDSVMAFWGAPVMIVDHSYRSCVAAVRSQRRMKVLNAKFAETGKSPLTVRIGIHSDQVLVGNIGSVERLSYTVMGDGVNIAARLEGINKDFGTSICISNAVFKESGERLWLRPIDMVAVKGRKGAFLIYEVLGIRDGDEEVAATLTEQTLCVETTKAYTLYAGGNWEAAEAVYQSLVDKFNDDLSRVMVSRCGVHAVGRATLFDGMTDEELDYLYGILTRSDLAKGTLIFSEGQADSRLFVIVKGIVSIKRRVLGTQRARRIATFGPSMAFGEMALLDGKPRSADAYAQIDLTVYSLNADQFAELRVTHPAIALRIISNLSGQLVARLRRVGLGAEAAQ